MRDIVQGKDFLLEGYKVDDYYPFACATNVRIRRTNEYDSTVTPDSGEMRSRKPTGLSDLQVEFTGVTVLQDAVDTLWFGWEFLTKQMRDQGIQLRLTLRDAGNNVRQLQGFFYPQEIELNGDAGNTGEDRILFIGGGGAFDTNGGITPPEITAFVERVQFTVTGGSATVTDSRLEGLTAAQVLHVSREGDDKYKVIESGTPTEREVLLDNTSGSLSFLVPLDALEDVFALIRPY